MTILYISKLSGNPWAGPNYSVPAQVAAQAKIDDVFWYNINTIALEPWKNISAFHNLNDYPSGYLKDLPAPFSNPDLAVFENFYSFTLSPIISDIQNNRIPYIIIPRGSLSAQAQNRKKLKKIIGNIVFFKAFAKKAAAIQYLTQQEYMVSGDKWNKNCIIIPNGITIKDQVKQIFNSDGIKITFIGRVEPYHKGLDLLAEACSGIAGDLNNANVKFYIYGPDWQGGATELKAIISKYKLDNLFIVKDAVYEKEKEVVLLESDVFIMTSRFEGHPMGLIEALSYGLPCLVTRGSNMLPEIEENDAGWTAESEILSIQSALLKMIQEKELFTQKGKNARELARKYDWNVIAQLSNNIFKELLGDKQ